MVCSECSKRKESELVMYKTYLNFVLFGVFFTFMYFYVNKDLLGMILCVFPAFGLSLLYYVYYKYVDIKHVLRSVK